MYIFPVHWQFGQLDQHPIDGYVKPFIIVKVDKWEQYFMAFILFGTLLYVYFFRAHAGTCFPTYCQLCHAHMIVYLGNCLLHLPQVEWSWLHGKGGGDSSVWTWAHCSNVTLHSDLLRSQVLLHYPFSAIEEQCRSAFMDWMLCDTPFMFLFLYGSTFS